MKKHNQKGFTLIEVILVLAIGGLIFLLAFLAFQQVSRNRRDTQRRADGSRLLADLQNYAADNNGAYPAGPASNTPFNAGAASADAPQLSTFINDYMDGSNFTTPNGQVYVITTSNDGPTLAYMGALAPGRIILYRQGGICGTTLAGTTAGAAGNVAVSVHLENGSWSCRDNR